MTESNNKTTLQYTCIYHKKNDGIGGFAIDKESKLKIKIDGVNELFALHLDEVIVEVEVDLGDLDHVYGRIIKVTKHNTKYLVGRIQRYKNEYLVRVTTFRFGGYLVKLVSTPEDYSREKTYEVEILTYPDLNQPYFEVKLKNQAVANKDPDTADEYMEQLIVNSELPVEFSTGAIRDADNLPEFVTNNDISQENRVDLRELGFVTIDGEDAKDFDDAVYCELKDGVFHLYVAIADVANYVKTGSALDKDAYLRGNSVYFPRVVIPMLPEKISNGLCSLNPNVDRLVMCCEIQISQEGLVQSYKVYNAVINSKARLTYNKVQEWLTELANTPLELVENISNLYLVYMALNKARSKRGAINFESNEPYFIFDDENQISKIIPRNRQDAHKLIEECMLVANVCVADFLLSNKHPTLYRNHDKPSEEKFNALKEYLNSLAIPFDVKYDDLTPISFARLLDFIHDHPDFATVQQTILRTMQLAVYDQECIGHFGLSYDRYLHFTSPIRRYPDLLVHRAVKAVLKNNIYEFNHSLEVAGEHLSFTERRSEDLERKLDAYYKCQYAKTHIGSQFEGVVASVVSFGLFIYMKDLMLEGMLHVTELAGDYYVYDETKHVLVGKKNGQVYSLGQILKVEIFNVDMAKLFIDLKLVKEI